VPTLFAKRAQLASPEAKHRRHVNFASNEAQATTTVFHQKQTIFAIL
jgi:hypothetical protein